MKKPVLPEIILIEIGKLHFNKDNPRQIKTREFNSLVKSLEDAPEMFEARPLLVSDRTGELIVIGGNMRLRAAQKLKYKKVPAIIISGLTEEKEKEIAIKDNGAWGEWDWETLANSWDHLPLNEWGVNINIFTPPDDPQEEWSGMPEFENEPKAFRSIIVHFKTEEDVKTFFKKINQSITSKTKYIWFPERERENLKAMKYKTEKKK